MIFYVNWDEHKILTNKEMSEVIQLKEDELCNDDIFVNDYCEAVGITPFDILSASQNDREKIMLMIKAGAKERAHDWFAEWYERYLFIDDEN